MNISPVSVVLVGDPSESQMVVGALGSLGHQTVIATKFKDALEMTKGRNVQLIITDLISKNNSKSKVFLLKKFLPQSRILAIVDAVDGDDVVKDGADAVVERGKTADEFCAIVTDLLESSSKPAAHRLSATVVDGDPQIAEILCGMLEKLEFTATSHQTVEDAFSSLQSSPPDLMVLDVYAPVSGGIDLIFRVKDNWPDLPILAISNDVSDMPADKALKAATTVGAGATLTKPFAQAQFEGAVFELLFPS